MHHPHADDEWSSARRTASRGLRGFPWLLLRLQPPVDPRSYAVPGGGHNPPASVRGRRSILNHTEGAEGTEELSTRDEFSAAPRETNVSRGGAPSSEAAEKPIRFLRSLRVTFRGGMEIAERVRLENAIRL